MINNLKKYHIKSKLISIFSSVFKDTYNEIIFASSHSFVFALLVSFLKFYQIFFYHVRSFNCLLEMNTLFTSQTLKVFNLYDMLEIIFLMIVNIILLLTKLLS